MSRFPITYDLTLERRPGSAIDVHAGRRPSLAVGPPPEFGGNDVWWSPEHLLVSAAATCFATTLIAVAEHSGIALGGLRLGAKGTLDKTESGIGFTSIRIELELELANDEDSAKAERVVEKAKKQCFVANSLRCPVDVTVNVSSKPSAAGSHPLVA